VEILEQTLGSETVLEAVKRNEVELSQRATPEGVAAAAAAAAAPPAPGRSDSAVSTASGFSPPEVGNPTNESAWKVTGVACVRRCGAADTPRRHQPVPVACKSAAAGLRFPEH